MGSLDPCIRLFQQEHVRLRRAASSGVAHVSEAVSEGERASLLSLDRVCYMEMQGKLSGTAGTPVRCGVVARDDHVEYRASRDFVIVL